MRLARSALLVSGIVLSLALLPPVASAGSCSGTWVGSAACSFSCTGALITVSGFAQDPTGLPASVTVVGECGIVNFDGTFTPLFSASCSAGGANPVSCTSSGVSVPGLVGMCTVTGSADGTFSCTG